MALIRAEGRNLLDDNATDDNATDDALAESMVEPDSATRRGTLPLRALPLGYYAFAIAVVLVVAEGVAVVLANSREPGGATVIGQILVVLTGLPLALGLFAALRGPRREWGIAAMVIAVIANPLVLINVLSFFGAV